MSVEPKSRDPQDDHALYTGAAVLALGVVFAGFSRTFFLKRVFGTPELPWLPIVHGIVMTLWFSLFLVQARLVATGRSAVHRRLGVLGAFLALAVVIVGVSLGISAARLGHSPGPPPLIFLGVPLFDMLVFALLFSAAIHYRKQVGTHRRLMLVANLAMLTAAIARIPITFIHDGGLLMYFGLTDLLIVLCVAYDSVRHRRLHPAFGWATALVLASLPLRLWVMGTPTWMKFATWVVK
jgi:hypothetical protein